MMQTITVDATVSEDGTLHLDVPGLPPGPVRVVLSIRRVTEGALNGAHDITELRGLNVDAWKGIDAQEWVNRVRRGDELP